MLSTRKFAEPQIFALGSSQKISKPANLPINDPYLDSIAAVDLSYDSFSPLVLDPKSKRYPSRH